MIREVHVVDQKHSPVMVGEVLHALNVQDDGTYVDATFGAGGHTKAILDQLSPNGRVLAIDRDPNSYKFVNKLFSNERRLTFIQRSFSDLSLIVDEHNLNRCVVGIVIDLGVSSMQLDEADRGFSFMRNGPLDMRMDPSVGETAADWLNRVEEQELRRVLREFGEERFAGRIARNVIKFRKIKPIRTTKVLSKLVADSVPTREYGKHPATRSFQAIRIHINGELEELRTVLHQAIDTLAIGGRLVVISFHSLEDRCVKSFMRKSASGDCYPPDLPITDDQIHPTLRLLGKPIRPTPIEIESNPRSRSAILRSAEKLKSAI